MAQRPDFPDYSIDLYGRGNVEKSCLKLQDDYGLDVNTVLFCYWFGAHHGVIDEDLWQRIEQISGQWQSQVVRPLREARRRLKNPGFEPDQEQGPLIPQAGYEQGNRRASRTLGQNRRSV